MPVITVKHNPFPPEEMCICGHKKKDHYQGGMCTLCLGPPAYTVGNQGCKCFELYDEPTVDKLRKIEESLMRMKNND